MEIIHVIFISCLFRIHTICIEPENASCLYNHISGWYMGGRIALHQTERWLANMQIHLRKDQIEPLYLLLSCRLQSIGDQPEPHPTLLKNSIWHVSENLCNSETLLVTDDENIHLGHNCGCQQALLAAPRWRRRYM